MKLNEAFDKNAKLRKSSSKSSICAVDRFVNPSNTPFPQKRPFRTPPDPDWSRTTGEKCIKYFRVEKT
eukprot:6187964-Pleurochrysis_carterae.AAC.2